MPTLPVLYGIRAIAQRTGVSTSVVAYAARHGFLPPVAQLSSGTLLFDDHSIETFKQHRRLHNLPLLNEPVQLPVQPPVQLCNTTHSQPVQPCTPSTCATAHPTAQALTLAQRFAQVTGTYDAQAAQQAAAMFPETHPAPPPPGCF